MSAARQPLIGRSCQDQSAPVGRGIVNELPLVVFPLVVELANRRVLAGLATPTIGPRQTPVVAGGRISRCCSRSLRKRLELDESDPAVVFVPG